MIKFVNWICVEDPFTNPVAAHVEAEQVHEIHAYIYGMTQSTQQEPMLNRIGQLDTSIGHDYSKCM